MYHPGNELIDVTFSDISKYCPTQTDWRACQMDNIEQRKIYKGIKKWIKGNKISGILALGMWEKREQRAQPHAENWHSRTA